MSYILDALKKSDQERKHGEVPGLNSFQEQPKPPIATSRILLYLLVGVILINILIIGLWVTFRQDPADTRTAEVSGTSTELPKTSREELSSAKSSESTTGTSPVAESAKKKEVAKSPPERKPASEPAILTDTTETPPHSADFLPEEMENEPAEEGRREPTLTSFEKLPADVRNDLPALSIAAHYYARKASSRMASINGRIMRQGQTISNGLVLEEITREGVIFRFRDYLFSMDVFIR